MNTHMGKHPSFGKPKPAKKGKPESHFEVHHYAGERGLHSRRVVANHRGFDERQGKEKEDAFIFVVYLLYCRCKRYHSSACFDLVYEVAIMVGCSWL